MPRGTQAARESERFAAAAVVRLAAPPRCANATATRSCSSAVICGYRGNRTQWSCACSECVRSVTQGAVAVGRLPMAAHDAAPGADPCVQHCLHHPSLVAVIRQPHAVALPVGPRPIRFEWQRDSRNVRQQRPVRVRQLASPGNDLRQALQLLAPDRGLDVGHAVVVADRGVRLEDHLRRAVPHRVRNTHRMLAQQAELLVPLGVARRDHAAVAGADDLARVERKAGDVAVRPADLLPLAIPEDLAADRAGGVLDERNAVHGAPCGTKRPRSHGMPIWCTHRIARVRGVMACSTSAGSMLYVSGSMSTKTGSAPM